ncbi:MAG: response regulator [Deltaproteobacteria bacterium]|nr:MAG: response regulator [Deltaproteobacteria bacterium]TMB40184.1 MAG: response regulator [Deltaproteobacteria bacterium]
MIAATNHPDSPAGPNLVLVVDDDFDIREALSDVLASEGYSVLTAADGGEALERLRGGVRPAVMLLDLMMPRVSGVEVIDALRKDESLSKIPVVVCSANRGYGPDDLGVHDVLRKPVSVEELLEAVARAIRPRPPLQRN